MKTAGRIEGWVWKGLLAGIAWAACGLALAAQPLRAAEGDPLGGLSPLAGPGGQPPVVTVSAQFTKPEAGKPARLFVTAKIAKGWHIYSVTQKKGGPLATKIKLPRSVPYKLVGDFKPSPPPHVTTEPVWGNLPIETHEGEVTWCAPIELASGVDPSTLKIEGKVNAQACNETGCLPPKDVEFTAELGKGVEVKEQNSKERGNAPSAGNSDQSTARFDETLLVVSGDDELAQMPAALAMLFGFLGGALLNLMPCVLPVIGLKILSFVEQSGQSRRRIFLLNLWYSLGMMSVFLLLATLAVFAGFGWGQLFAYREFNIGLAAVVFAMSLSFLGVWEIPIPGFVGTGKANDLAAREGAPGAFAKGAITTVLATPCSGPFLASALFWAVAQPAHLTYAVFASVGLGMASPYLLIGAFPRLIRRLPKPGAWMDTFKQTMGFVLLGTVVYIVTLVPWASMVPTLALLFGIWGGCWWIGRTPLTAALGPKTRAWIEATAFVALVGWFSFGWLDQVMEYRLAQTIDSELAKRMTAAGEASGGLTTATKVADADELAWQPFSRRRLEELTGEQKTVLVDFTAPWCQTCKVLESTVLNTEPTRQLIDANGVVTLQAIWTEEYPDTAWMLNRLGSKQIPVVAIFPAGHPNEPIVLRGTYVRQTLLDAINRAGPSRDAVAKDAESDATAMRPPQPDGG